MFWCSLLAWLDCPSLNAYSLVDLASRTRLTIYVELKFLYTQKCMIGEVN